MTVVTKLSDFMNPLLLGETRTINHELWNKLAWFVASKMGVDLTDTFTDEARQIAQEEYDRVRTDRL